MMMCPGTLGTRRAAGRTRVLGRAFWDTHVASRAHPEPSFGSADSACLAMPIVVA